MLAHVLVLCFEVIAPPSLGWLCRCTLLYVPCQSGSEQSMSLDEIRSMIRAENATLLDATLQKLEGCDRRKAGWSGGSSHEGDFGSTETYRAVVELRDRDRADESDDSAAHQEARRRRRSLSAETGNAGMGPNARGRAALRRHDDDEERHTVVFSGFPRRVTQKASY